jgi:maleamate amidohydrolase
MKSWGEIYSPEDRAVRHKTGMIMRQAFGNKPALLVIDVNRRTLGTREPILQAMEKNPLACGEAGWIALEHIQKLLDACRKIQIPAVFTTGDAILRQFCGSSGKSSISKPRKLDLEAEEIPEDIKPLPSELVIRKTKASAFFRTPLDHCLRGMGVDCLLVAGNSTSGCVRASVVDAFSHGYRVFVVEECCYDRFQLSHLVNLFDMDLKYADVITMNEALGYAGNHRTAL